MSLPAFDRGWVDGLRAQAMRPSPWPRLPLRLRGQPIGSLAGHLLDRLGGAVALQRCGLQPDGAAWGLPDDPSDAFARLGAAVRIAGLAPHWRDEPLPVRDDAGRPMSQVPRGLVRLLGIRTYAVHLVGVVDGVGCWVQQRALDKAEDPGRWDTLMSGTIGAGETNADTLARETWEEAGLRIETFAGLRPCGQIRLDRPQGPGFERGLRHQVEWIDCYVAGLAPDRRPVNRDGEVLAFECLAPDALAARLRAGLFTLEASLALALAGA